MTKKMYDGWWKMSDVRCYIVLSNYLQLWVNTLFHYTCVEAHYNYNHGCGNYYSIEYSFRFTHGFWFHLVFVRVWHNFYLTITLTLTITNLARSAFTSYWFALQARNRRNIKKWTDYTDVIWKGNVYLITSLITNE